MPSIIPLATEIATTRLPHWPLQTKGQRSNLTHTAVIRGGGPSALAASIAIAQAGWHVQLASLRSATIFTRTAAIVLRPNAAIHLQALGVLQYLEDRGAIPFMSSTQLENPYLGIHATLKNVDFRAPEYDEENPMMNSVTFTLMLNSLEEALAHRARELGVVIHEEATVRLERRAGTKRMHATLKFTGTSSIEKQKHDVDLGFPDLVVCASGKGDKSLERELGVERLHGINYTADTLPVAGSRMCRFGEAGEIETQYWLNVGPMRVPEDGSCSFLGRWFEDMYPSGDGIDGGDAMATALPHKQPTADFIMRWPARKDDAKQEGIFNVLSMIPRGFDIDAESFEARILEKVNHYLGSDFKTYNDLAAAHLDPESAKRSKIPVKVERCSLPTYVYGSNVVVIGDAAASCTPAGGIGASIGFFDDNVAISLLAQRFGQRYEAKFRGEEPEMSREAALDEFNLNKAKGTLKWVDTAFYTYVTTEEAKKIAARVKAVKTDNGSLSEGVTLRL